MEYTNVTGLICKKENDNYKCLITMEERETGRVDLDEVEAGYVHLKYCDDVWLIKKYLDVEFRKGRCEVTKKDENIILTCTETD